MPSASAPGVLSLSFVLIFLCVFVSLLFALDQPKAALRVPGGHAPHPGSAASAKTGFPTVRTVVAFKGNNEKENVVLPTF